MWIHISVEIFRNRASGRLVTQTYKSEHKAVAFSTMLQNKFLWFLYFKKKQAAFRYVGANF